MVINIFVSLASYMLISWSSNTVIYPASAVLGMLRRELLVIDGMRWMSFTSWPMSKGSSLMESAAVCVPLGSWNILFDDLPVGTKEDWSLVAPTFDVAALSTMIDGMVPLRTPLLMADSKNLLIASFWFGVCSLTWQSGGVGSDNG